MKLTQEQSSMFSEIDYIPEQETLAVRYRHGGKLYHHVGVTSGIWIEMLDAIAGPDLSVGKIFHARVKKQFPGVEVKEPPADLPIPPEPTDAP